MDTLRVISADSHMTEPPDLWTTRLDRRFQDRAPRVVHEPDKPGHFFTAPGITPFPVAGGFSTGRSGEALKEHLKSGYEAARPSGWDPVERLKDQDLDGVAAEVIYTTLGLALFQLADADLQQACFGVYNDWVAEFRSHSPTRLHPVAMISLEDIPAAVAELQRAARLGLKGGMIWGAPPADRPYHSPLYDPFWAAAQDLQLPISLHVVTSRDTNDRVVMSAGSSGPVNHTALRFVHLFNEVQKSLSAFILGGVLERFSGPQDCLGRKRCGLVCPLPAPPGPRPGEVWRDGRAAPAAQAQRVCPASDLGHLSGRPGRSEHLSFFWRGQLHVGLGLSAHRHDVAQLTPRHYARLCRRTGAYHPQDGVRERGPPVPD